MHSSILGNYTGLVRSSPMKLLEDSSSLGDKQWPPGFRFHPTDEELVLYYLKRKICRRRLKFNVIGEVDVYTCDPEELPGLSRLKTGDRQWFFFSPRDRKYPNGGRANRATKLGYWKATGKDRDITCNSRCVGNKKTLVFYKGRAPSGLRTDWVMHEYTLDEEELKRCPRDQDYYALYKLYKKSGPGPKNGEQYGAPFREEDWAEDENAIVIADSEQVIPPMLVGGHAPFDSTGTNCQANSQLNDLEEFMNQVANDPWFEPVMAFNNVLIAGADEEANTPWLQQSLFDGNVEDGAIVIPQNQESNDVGASFNPTQSATSLFQETSEVTSAPNKNRQGSCESKEDILEDFLEIDDLIIPELTHQSIENPVEGMRPEDINGLCELDLFQDANMFLQDVGNAEPLSNTCISNVENEIYSPVCSFCANNFECGVVDHVSNFCFDDFQTEMAQPTSDTTLDNEMGNQVNYQLPPDHAAASQLWIQNESFNTATQTQSNQGSITPTSGVICAGVYQSQSPKQNPGLNQNRSGRDNEGGDSWFSSTLWSFVESIPTTPASAAESCILVNKALERLSSFGGRRDNVKVSLANNKSAVAGDPAATRQRSRTRFNRGLLLFSILGVFCAVLCVMTETSIRVLSRCFS